MKNHQQTPIEGHSSKQLDYSLTNGQNEERQKRKKVKELFWVKRNLRDIKTKGDAWFWPEAWTRKV